MNPVLGTETMIYETEWFKLKPLFRLFVDFIGLNSFVLPSFIQEIYYKINRYNKFKFGIILNNLPIKYEKYRVSIPIINGIFNSMLLEERVIQEIKELPEILIIKDKLDSSKPNKYIQLRFYKTIEPGIKNDEKLNLQQLYRHDKKVVTRFCEDVINYKINLSTSLNKAVYIL